ncbi:MAG TPA: GNAT family N-acetyltransferase [Chloroflexi bacterium]|jgi:RimJ/RimL family protein N-acetyltransferase|nr:GNAT family N-acetyltransferase [Chloroflexota bacterium]
MFVGERITLRAWERSDLETFVRWFNDPEITIYLGDAYPMLSSEQELRFYERGIDDKHRYAIVERERDTLIGNCSLFDLDQKNRSAEVGIVIGEKAYWGRGYGREALGMLQEIAFEGLGLNRLYLRHVDFNERGHRAYLAAGFQVEGRLRQASFIKGRYHDDLIMSVLAEEYFSRKQTGPDTPE